MLRNELNIHATRKEQLQKIFSVVHCHKTLAQHFRKAPQNLSPMGLGDQNVLRFQFHDMYNIFSKQEFQSHFPLTTKHFHGCNLPM
jgi:hypothetical protein